MSAYRHYRSAVLALQFLTRLPTPPVRDFAPADLTRSSVWFPPVGVLIGGILALVAGMLAPLDEWAAAIVTLLVWVWITGGLHLDGLSDLADAAGAAHRDPARFHAVLKDPLIGSFGAMAMMLQLTTKLVFLMLLAKAGTAWALVVICAWARLGPLVWAHWLPVLRENAGDGPGTGERFGWAIDARAIFFWAVLLSLPIFAVPALAPAPLACLGWWAFLKYRLGGQTGDCLGAGVEISESAALAGFVLLTLMGH